MKNQNQLENAFLKPGSEFKDMGLVNIVCVKTDKILEDFFLTEKNICTILKKINGYNILNQAEFYELILKSSFINYSNLIYEKRHPN